MTAPFPGPFDVLQGTRWGRIIAPFMYKGYINCLLTEINSQSFTVVINRFSHSSPSSADDISLLVLYPSFLEAFMDDCYHYITGLTHRKWYNNFWGG